MVDFSSNISNKVFRSKIDSSMGSVSLNSAMFRVLSELDGIRDSAGVAKALNMNLNDLRDVLKKLHDVGLIEEVLHTEPPLERSFFLQLKDLYADLMGPIAGTLIKEEIAKMGQSPSNFPRSKAAELVERLAENITIEAKKNDFTKAMQKLI